MLANSQQLDNKKTGSQTDSTAVQKKGKNNPSFLTDNRPASIAQRKVNEAISQNKQTTIQRQANTTGLPDNLKSGIENLSGHSMDDVKVHYNSSAPTQLNAHAYAQGTDIHVAPGQEKHVPHEAWHVVQQKEGRVKPTKQLKSKVNINDDVSLEKEADVMGAKAMSTGTAQRKELKKTKAAQIIQGAWVKQGNTTVWQEREPAGNRFRPTGELKWKSWWKPRDFNEKLPVHELIPDKTNLAALGGNPTHLVLANENNMTQADLDQIFLMTNLQTLEFTHCVFPNGVDMNGIANLTNLRYLSFNNFNTNQFAGGGLGGIPALPALKTLRFIRCDFVHSDLAYQQLGTMTRLQYLDLNRTLTKEKTAGTDVQKHLPDGRIIRNVGVVSGHLFPALYNLAKHLGYMNLINCHAVTPGEMQEIADAGLLHGCIVKTDRGITPSREAQLTDLLERIH
jgi:Domain of unknown function (DUF4157)